MTPEQKRAAKWDSLLGYDLPLAPVTLYGDDGLPMGRSWIDEFTKKRRFEWNAPSTTDSISRGWDDDTREFKEVQTAWDGAVSEERRFGTPGHSRGLLLEFYPLLSAPEHHLILDPQLIPKSSGRAWRSLNPLETDDLATVNAELTGFDELVPIEGGAVQLRWKTLEQLQQEEEQDNA
jgi:hypothetical protein